MGDGRDPMQNQLSVVSTSPEEQFRAARTIARLALSSPNPHEDCQIVLEAAGLFDPQVLTGRPKTT